MGEVEKLYLLKERGERGGERGERSGGETGSGSGWGRGGASDRSDKSDSTNSSRRSPLGSDGDRLPPVRRGGGSGELKRDHPRVDVGEEGIERLSSGVSAM